MIRRILLLVTLSFMLESIANENHDEIDGYPIIGFWGVEKVYVDNKEDSGEDDSIWIFRQDKTIKIIHGGIDRIYPEGTWDIISKDSIRVSVREKKTDEFQIYRIAWKLSDDYLILNAIQNNKQGEIFLEKLNLDIEPTKPRKKK